MNFKYHLNKKINKIRNRLFYMSRCIKSFRTFNRQLKFTEPCIILMAKNFMKVGGIERRFFQYSNLLRETGYKVFIASVDGDGTPDLWLSKDKILNTIFLKILSHKYPIRFIEWNCGGKDKPYFFIKLLKTKVSIGVILHASNILWNYNFLKKCDYVICSHYGHGIRVPYLKHFPVIANAVSYNDVCYNFNSQRNGLIISRMAYDKLPSLQSFIELCQEFKLYPAIAGDIENCEGNEIKKILQIKYGLTDRCFVGRISTIEFLKNNGNQYLFVGGLGQVILEAGSLGFPCLICSLLGKNNSFFLTKDNINRVLQLNCSPRSIQEINTIKIENTKTMFKQLSFGYIDKFNVSSVITKECLIDQAYTKYLQIITKKFHN